MDFARKHLLKYGWKEGKNLTSSNFKHLSKLKLTLNKKINSPYKLAWNQVKVLSSSNKYLNFPPPNIIIIRSLFSSPQFYNKSNPASSANNIEVNQEKNPKMKNEAQSTSDIKLPVFNENIYTVPNFLCAARAGISPLLSYLIISSQFTPAILLLSAAALTDVLDGWIARVYPSQASVMGTFLDPLADKILVGTLFISLTYVSLIPYWLTGLILSRDILLILAGFAIRYKSLEKPISFRRYFDMTLPTAKLAPTFISKVNTGVQLSLIGVTLYGGVSGGLSESFLTGIWTLTAGTTVASALSYILTKNTFEYIKQKRK